MVRLGAIERGAQLVQGLADDEVLCIRGVMTKNQPRLARCYSRERGWKADGTWEEVPLGCGRYLIEQGFRVVGGRRRSLLTVRDAGTGQAAVTRASVM